MTSSPITIARTIANALNMTFHTHVVINTTQYFKNKQNIRLYVIKDSYYGEIPFRKYFDKELFKTSSGVYACLFMRDLLWAFQGKAANDNPNEGYTKAFLEKNLGKSIDYMLDRYKGGNKYE